MKPFVIPVTLILLSLTACISTNSNITPETPQPTPETQTTPTSQPTPVATNSGTTSGWESYTSTKDGYSTKFPQKPEEKTQNVPSGSKTIKQTIVSYNDAPKGRLYMIISNEYATNAPDFNAKANAKGIAKSIATSQGRTIISEQEITVAGLPAQEIVMKGKEGTWIAQVILDTNKSKVYNLYVLDSQGDASFPEAKDFLNSFTPPQ